MSEIKSKESTIIRDNDEDYLDLLSILDKFRYEEVENDVRFMGLLSTAVINFEELLGVSLIGREELTEADLAAETELGKFKNPGTIQ